MAKRTVYVLSDTSQQLRPVPPEHLRRQLVAGSPVVDERQKDPDPFDAAVEVLFFSYDEGVELILIEVFVGKGPEELPDVRLPGKPLGQPPQLRRPHADDRRRIDGRDQLHLKIPVLFVPQPEQLFPDSIHAHHSPMYSV